jgi:hypothetical protein
MTPPPSRHDVNAPTLGVGGTRPSTGQPPSDGPGFPAPVSLAVAPGSTPATACRQHECHHEERHASTDDSAHDQHASRSIETSHERTS